MRLKAINGDAVLELQKLKANSVDAIITDPPYSSGGMTAAARKASTGDKYCSNSKLPNFAGDQKDQLGQAYWMHLWLSELHRIAKDGAMIMVFTDWRQLPLTMNAVQGAGFITRGTIAWDKTNCRPQKGRPKNQCEYVVWGSKGNLPMDGDAPIIPGCFSIAPPATVKRIHQTEKPVELLSELVKVCEKGGTIIDPFMGSGSTGVAALEAGYKFIGIETIKPIFEVTQKRLQGTRKKRQ